MLINSITTNKYFSTNFVSKLFRLCFKLIFQDFLYQKKIILIRPSIKYESNFTEIIAILLLNGDKFFCVKQDQIKCKRWSDSNHVRILFKPTRKKSNLIFWEKFHFTLCIKLWWWWKIKCELQQFMQNKFQQFIPHYLKNCFHSHQLHQEFTNWAEKTCSICFCFYYTD